MRIFDPLQIEIKLQNSERKDISDDPRVNARRYITRVARFLGVPATSKGLSRLDHANWIGSLCGVGRGESLPEIADGISRTKTARKMARKASK